MRPLSQILTMGSPLLLAREASWRLRKKSRKKRILAQLGLPCPATFRNIPYYTPDVSNVAERSRQLLTAFADRVCEGRFPFLGYGTVDLGRQPKWNIDFVSGLGWPRIALENNRCVRFDGSDVKVPYELSRLQFLPVLGKAYRITGAQRYREAAKDLLSQWINENPVGVGVNWSIAMEVAIRAMSICFLLNLLSPFKPEEQPWLKVVTSSLWQHFLYIEANIEFSHFIASNHYLSNILGLYCLSLFLEGAPMLAKRRLYRERIEGALLQQVYEDGADYEASAGYHVLVFQMFLVALLLMRAANDSISPQFVEKMRRMNRVIVDLASSSGELPHLGDCDDGRVELLFDDVRQMLLLQVPERNSLCVSSLLGLGKCLFGEGGSSLEDAVWYGFSDSAPILCPQSNSRPVASDPVKILPNAGIAVLRNGPAELLFFAVPNGISGKGSHTHNDKLSFVLRVAGQEVLCDPGTGCYTRDIAIRNRFRSTAAHNTLLIDGIEQNRITPGPSGLFILGNEAAVSPIQLIKEKNGLLIRASHSGYCSIGVTHTRTIRMIDEQRAFVVEDELQGQGIHDFEFTLQLALNRTAELITAKDSISCRILGDPETQLAIAGPASLEASIEPSLVSTTYGTSTPAVKVRLKGKGVLPLCITTRISWAEVSGMTNDQSKGEEQAGFLSRVSEGVCQ